MTVTASATAPSHEFNSILAEVSLATFESDAKKILRRLDRNNAEVSFDFQREQQVGGKVRPANLLNYYRQEVARIPRLEKEQEFKFCMAIEILWRRLKTARRAAGFSVEDVEQFPGTANAKCLNCSPGRSLLCQGCAPINLDFELAERLRARTQEFEIARNELIARHLFLVFSLLNRYRKVNVSEEDLIQEANFSMFKAVQGFDFTRGVRFRTYAGYWVNQAFLNAIYNQSRVVRVPAYIQKAMKKVNDARSDGGDPILDVKELASKSGLTPELLNTATNGNRFTLSLDKIIDDDGARMVDLFSGDDEADQPQFGEGQHLEVHLGKALEKLNERERLVLELRFGLNGYEPDTLQAVGDRLQVSLERVRQIQKAALLKLRNGPRAQSLAQYA